MIRLGQRTKLFSQILYKVVSHIKQKPWAKFQFEHLWGGLVPLFGSFGWALTPGRTWIFGSDFMSQCSPPTVQKLFIFWTVIPKENKNSPVMISFSYAGSSDLENAPKILVRFYSKLFPISKRNFWQSFSFNTYGET